MSHCGTTAPRAEDKSAVARRCLSIPEVLEEVTGYLAADRSEKSLAYLARTWKRFHEVAQNALWRNASLECVLECFPRASWEMDKSTVRFIRSPLPLEWKQFVLQAARVHNLTLWMYHKKYSEMLHTLSIYTASHLLFPNLRTLVVWEDTLHFLPFFLSSKLRSLTLKYEFGSIHRLAAIHALQVFPYSCPLLRKLVVESDGIRLVHLGNPLSQALQLFEDMQVLQAPMVWLEDDAIIHLSTLPSLRTLVCSAQPIRISGEVIHGNTHAFPSLTSMTLYLTEFNEASRLLITASESDQLATISLHSVHYPDQRTLGDHLEGLQKFISSLQHIELCFPALPPHAIYLRPASFADLPACIIDERVLAHLLPFCGLVYLQILSPHIGLDDKDIRDLTAAMPKLKHLILLPTFYRRSPPRATAQCIAYAATSCADLETLGLRFNATQPRCRITAGTKSNSTLDTLFVGDSAIKLPGSVALFLSAIFSNPRLCVDDGPFDFKVDEDYREEREEYSALWQEAENLFKNFCLARTQEHTRENVDLVFSLV